MRAAQRACRRMAIRSYLIMTCIGVCVSTSPLGSIASADPPQRIKWAVALHGGAGSSPVGESPEAIEARRESLKQAIHMGAEILSTGGRSLDAVEAVIKTLEDDPLFNAGRGAVFTEDGGHELDAAIMDGRRRDCGAVASIRFARHPIEVARLVMEKTDHVLLVGAGADNFARKMGVTIVDNRFYDTVDRKRQWKKSRNAKRDEEGGSTVGCVALDMLGDLAAGTSTGGLSNKMSGRVGDSPIVGAGTFADNATCAVSCTGWGEQFIRHAVAHDVSARMAYAEKTLEESVELVFTQRLEPGWGGLIAVDGQGRICMKYNTAAMARAAADSSGRLDVVWGVEATPQDDQNDDASD